MDKKIKRTFFKDQGFGAIQMVVDPYVEGDEATRWVDINLDIHDGFRMNELVDCCIFKKSTYNQRTVTEAFDKITTIEKYLQRTRNAIKEAMAWSEESTGEVEKNESGKARS